MREVVVDIWVVVGGCLLLMLKVNVCYRIWSD